MKSSYFPPKPVTFGFTRYGNKLASQLFCASSVLLSPRSGAPCLDRERGASDRRIRSYSGIRFPLSEVAG
ncbi:hypothetical protein XENTR_v10007676 [Xenopus tropicalis]|nr:hypothetical protein XENTR_v10007676 [Xenopus tropicalis]